jgi:ketosteroid isomerase-like protein
MSDANVRVIQSVYAAFGRGDVATILGHVAEDATFSFNEVAPIAPWHGTFRGKSEIPRFFESLATGTDAHAFVPEPFVASGPHVVVGIRFEHTPKSSGRRIVERQVHWWTFDGSGKIAGIVHYTDTQAFNDAYRR